MNDSLLRSGMTLVISGPSGSGKSTLYRAAMKQISGFEFSVSCTTRAPRPGETDGVDYHFISRTEYDRLVAQNAFAEHAEVHGNGYGTLKSELTSRMERGIDVLLDIDVQGVAQLQEHCTADRSLADSCVFVFIAPPSFRILEQRLRGRGTESEESLLRRLHNAHDELRQWKRYDFVVVNDNLDSAVTEFVSIIRSMRISTKRFRKDPFHV